MPVIATNTSANSALIYLNRNSAEQQSSLSKISSGTRIVRASDDAAGLAVSSRITADITTLEQASRNATQAAAVLQTADGALARIGDILQRLKSLAAQAVSGSVDAASRGFINQEYQLLITEINDIATQTEFNGTALIDGNYNESFLVGVDSADTIDVDFSVATGANPIDVQTGSASTILTDGVTNLAGTDVLTVDAVTPAGANLALNVVDASIDAVSGARAQIGAQVSRFEYRAEYIDSAVENLTAANSSLKDVDIAAEQTKLVASQVLTEASIAALAQANQSKSSLLALLR